MNKIAATIPLFPGYSPRTYIAENKSITNQSQHCSIHTLICHALHLPLLTCSASRILNTLSVRPTHVCAQWKAERKIITPNISYLKALHPEAVDVQTSLVVPLPSLEWFLAPCCNAAPLQVDLWGSQQGRNEPC